MERRLQNDNKRRGFAKALTRRENLQQFLKVFKLLESKTLWRRIDLDKYIF